MNLRFNLKSIASLAFASALLFSCSSDSSEDVLGTNPEEEGGPTTTETATIRVTEGGATDDKFEAMVTGEAGMTAQARVILKGTDKTQRRLYVTKQELGGLAEPFIIPELNNKQKKRDGSIDLTSESKNELDFTFDLDVPTGMTNGSIVYKFWTTSGRGDFREQSKRLVAGVGTVTVSIGDGTNPDAALREATITLKSPLEDGTSETFASILDLDQVYKIKDGSELAALWDYGYFFGFTNKASLVSTYNYPSDIVDVKKIANENKLEDEAMVETADFNKMYFKLNNSADFDGASISNDFEALTVSVTDAQRVTKLEEGNIIEFLIGNTESNQKKGLIKVGKIVEGNGNVGSIVLSIKVQP